MNRKGGKDDNYEEECIAVHVLAVDAPPTVGWKAPTPTSPIETPTRRWRVSFGEERCGVPEQCCSPVEPQIRRANQTPGRGGLVRRRPRRHEACGVMMV